uniref:Protein krueppel n=1 Tax=Heliothis virescens TaxID=7102 RepID=A0A2A4J6N3_HELVI
MKTNLCRLCCQNEGTVYIFNSKVEDIEVSSKIMYCCPNINIKGDDGLPSSICNNCNEDLAICYQFILKCEASDKKLRSQCLALKVISKVMSDLGDCEPKLEVKSEAGDSDGEQLYVEDEDIPLEQIKLEQLPTVEPNIIPRKRRTYTVRSKCKDMLAYPCANCGRAFANPSTYKVHMRSHTDEKPHSCPMCDKKYKDSSALKRHIDNAHSQIPRRRERDFVCEHCGKAFYGKADVIIHMRTHTGETPYKCTICGAKFTQISGLQRHKKRHTGEKNHLCTACPKTFCTKEELKNHQLVHSNVKTFTCSLCNSQFKYKNNLRKHMNLHSESSNFVCSYCGRTFKLKGNLKIHIDSQHSEKSGYCNICIKHVPNMEMHMWRHTGQRPIKCGLCESSFFEHKALARHMNFKHTKTDKYKCEFEGCNQSYPSKPMLDFHFAKVHTTDIPFPCDRCSRGFYRKNDLARHKIGTHKERLS